MATRTAELKIGISGEREYKAAIADINRGNQVLNAEMKKLAEQYKGNEDSMEAMRAKSDLLQRQLQQQRDKIETLREAVKNAGRQYGEADRRTQSWQTQLLNAEREQIRLERSLSETNRALNEQDKAVADNIKKLSGLGDQISFVAEKLGIRLPSAAKDALDGMSGFSAGTVAAMGAAATAIGLAYKAASSLHELTKEAAARADALNTRAAQTGLDTTLLQGLDYAQRFLDFDGIDRSLVRLTDSMDKARDGAEKQAAAFETLGVSVTGADGQLRNNFETFKDVIDALGQVENAAERDALANDLFGKSYSELKPLIDAGSEALQGYIDKAVESGYVMENDQLRVLQEVDDTVQENEVRWEALQNRIAVEFAPASKQAVELFGDAAETAADRLINSGLLADFASIIEDIGKIAEAGNDLFNLDMPGWLDPILNLLSPLEMFTGAIHGLSSVMDFVSGGTTLVGDFFDSLFDSGEPEIQRSPEMQARPDDINRAKNQSITSVISASRTFAQNAAGDVNWRGGLTWVGEEGPELVNLPQGSRIYSNPESERIAAGTDVSRIESLLERSAAILQRIDDELTDLEAIRRMI